MESEMIYALLALKNRKAVGEDNIHERYMYLKPYMSTQIGEH